MTLQGAVADALVSAIEANAAQVQQLITEGEGSVEGFILNALANVKFSGLIGVIYPAIAGSLEAEVKNLVAQYGPAVAYQFVLAEAQSLAKSLGG